jgi:hypothetical protein
MMRPGTLSFFFACLAMSFVLPFSVLLLRPPVELVWKSIYPAAALYLLLLYAWAKYERREPD